MTDVVESFGMVRVKKRDKLTGEVIYDQWFKNQITNFARGQSAALWSGIVVQAPTQISVGTGAPPTGQSGVLQTDTSLWAEVAGSRKLLDYAQVWLQYFTQYSVTYLSTEVLGVLDPTTNLNSSITLTEAGLYDPSGNLWSHVILNGVTHDNTSTLSIQWQIEQRAN